MKSRLILGSVLIVIMVTCIGFYMYNRPMDMTVTGKPAFIVSASELFTEFAVNEAKANGKYLNKVVSVIGEITDIQAVDSAGVNLTLGTGNGIFGISCQISDPRQMNALQSGDKVRVKGLCTGMLMDVVLVRCVIENQ